MQHHDLLVHGSCSNTGWIMSSPLAPEASISAPQADGSSPASSNGPPPRDQEPLRNAPQTPECSDSDAFSIEEIAQIYPLPAVDTLSLTYEQTPAGTIKVHRQIRRNGKTKRVPVATPFGVLARLRFVDLANGFGLRVAVQDMCGHKREIDVDRAAFGRMSAEVKALLFNAGLRLPRQRAAGLGGRRLAGTTRMPFMCWRIACGRRRAGA